jgi:hypothetical protein
MAYRSEEESLKQRQTQLQSELEQVRAAREKVEAFLRRVRVASPCTASWDKMVGDDRVRFCGDCKKNVYNLSAMTSAEAKSFIEGVEQAPCVRFFQRADGTMLTSDCPVGATKKKRRLGLIGGASAALLTAGGALMAVAGIRSRQGGMQQHTMMGEIVAPEAMQGAVYMPPEPSGPIPEQAPPKALEPQAQPPQPVVPK